MIIELFKLLLDIIIHLYYTYIYIYLSKLYYAILEHFMITPIFPTYMNMLTNCCENDSNVDVATTAGEMR
jgi:hypothetical protein